MQKRNIFSMTNLVVDRMGVLKTVLIVAVLVIHLTKADSKDADLEVERRQLPILPQPIFPVPQASMMPPPKACPLDFIFDHGQWNQLPTVLPIQYMCGIKKSMYTGKRDVSNLFTDHIRKKRVIGGQVSADGQWPWLAAIFKMGEPVCTGSLISPRWVLSAAHCFFDPQKPDPHHDHPCDYAIQLGENAIGAQSPEMQILPVDKIVIIPTYDSVNMHNDIAMVRLAVPAALNQDVNPVCLPNPGESFNTGCMAAGWGRTVPSQSMQSLPPSPVLKHLPIEVIPSDQCIHKGLNHPFMQYVDPGKICVNNQPHHDLCFGDSGGPLICPSHYRGTHVQTGVLSLGTDPTMFCGLSSGVGSPHPLAKPPSPTIYTNVPDYMVWIQSVIGRYGGA